MTSAPQSSANFCYRHPDRQSYILCQRCGRTICPECQTQAAVGVHCPECVREAQQDFKRTQPSRATRFTRAARSSNQPVITYTLIGANVVVYLLQLLSGGLVDQYGVYRPVLTLVQPWTMLTSLFLHGSPLHILFNMYSLFIFGPMLEQMLGRYRFLALYLIAGFGGSVAVLLLAPGGGVLGASGAIFGLMGAFFIIQRGLGGNNIQILVIVGINLAMGFFLQGVSWQAHVGGLLAGMAVAFVYMRTRRENQKSTQTLLVAGVAAALVAIVLVRIFVL